MSWQNQYIHLVTTKPDLLVAEKERETPVQSRGRIQERMRQYRSCFVELGSGSGMHLIRLAQLYPDVLCIGLEIRFKRAFKTAEKAERLGLANVLVLRTDARGLPELFNEGEVSGFFVNYPDPWDKRRWRKNRLLNDELLVIMHRLLTTEGFLRYKTDHHEYFDSTMAVMRESQWMIQKHTTDLLQSEWVENNIPTEFEYLFRSQEKPLCMLEVLKK